MLLMTMKKQYDPTNTWTMDSEANNYNSDATEVTVVVNMIQIQKNQS